MKLNLTRVVCESGDGLETIEGVVVDGVPLAEWGGPWDFDSTFVVLEDDGRLTRVNGWVVQTQIIEGETDGAA
jgi:hypothetical protein